MVATACRRSGQNACDDASSFKFRAVSVRRLPWQPTHHSRTKGSHATLLQGAMLPQEKAEAKEGSPTTECQAVLAIDSDVEFVEPVATGVDLTE